LLAAYQEKADAQRQAHLREGTIFHIHLIHAEL
jgi:hypothetical protein